MPTPIIVLTGATASGKESAGLLLAERLGTEIVTVDSIKVYRGLDIGTAKATPDQRARVRHHCLDLADPCETFSTGRWREAAQAAIADIASRGLTPLLVGGTALYLKALTEGLMDGPGSDPALREQLNDEADRLGLSALHARLAELDPLAACRIHPNDRLRIIRALEVAGLTGRPISAHQQQWDRPDPQYAVTWLGIRRERADVRDRVGQRVDRMLAGGLVDEVRRLLAAPGGLGPTAGIALAYREFAEHLAGRLTWQQARQQTIDHTRQFAKRQDSWFRRFEQVRWVDAARDDSAESLADRLEAELRRVRSA